MNRATAVWLSIMALGAIAIVGCSTKSDGARDRTASSLEAGASTAKPTSSQLNVDDAIAKACGLPTPHFDFDSANVETRSDANLDKVVSCFTTGPLAGRRLSLIGHADPRGEAEYNLALGQRRAGDVAIYLEHKGLQSTRVATSSRGAFDATGRDEQGWAQDRRVDMGLVN